MSTVFTRQELKYLIARGHVLVVHGKNVYRLNSWLKTHPGGALSILHFVGRDAWCEIEAYHSDEALARMKSFVVGTVDKEEGAPWNPITPPVQLGWPTKARAYANVPPIKKCLQDFAENPDISSAPLYPLPPGEHALEPPPPPAGLDVQQEHQRALAWKEMFDQLRSAGLFKHTPVYNYQFEFLRYATFFALFAILFRAAESTSQYLVSAIPLGILFHQLTFLVHDSGHGEITGVFWKDRLLGTFIADFIGGLSVGWWCDNHDVHHLVTNHIEHDPDIQHMPFFAISTRFFENKFSTYYRRVMKVDFLGRIVLPVQHYLYYIILFFARFNLFALSYEFILFRAKNNRWKALELTGIAFYWYWFGGLVLGSMPGWWTRFAFLIICFGTASPVHLQILLSHYGQDTTDWGLYESFPRRQLRTTMDVTCHPMLDFLHGGLNFQIAHHLFPRMPRHHLRKASEYIEQYCRDQDLPYETWTFLDGNAKVCGVLQDVARQANVIFKVAQAQAAGKLH